MTRNNKIRSVAALLAVMLMMTACSTEDAVGGTTTDVDTNNSLDTADTDTPQNTASGDPLTIAVITTLSGAASLLGVETRNGTEIAIDEINNAGGVNGRPLALRAYDGQLSPETVVDLATRAASSDNALGIIGPHSTSEALALGPVAERLETPFINVSAATTEVTGPDVPYSFRTTVVNADLTQGVFAFALAIGVERPAMLHDDSGFGVAFSEGLQDIADERNIEIVANEEHPVGATDLTAQLQRIRAADADGILIGCASGADAGLAYRQMVDLGLQIPVVGSSCALQSDAVRVGGDALDQIDAYGLQAMDTTKPALQEFFEEYINRFGATPSGEYAAAAYDAVRLYARALEATDGEGGEALRNALLEIDDYEPVNGKQGAQFGFSEGRQDYLSGDYLAAYQVMSDGSIERQDVDFYEE